MYQMNQMYNLVIIVNKTQIQPNKSMFLVKDLPIVK